MDMQYKIYAEDLQGRDDAYFYDTEAEARRAYNRRKNEKTLKTRYAELWSTDYDIETDDWHLVEGFEREVGEVLGYLLFTGKMITY